jgi:hypothetical protein
LVVEAEVDLVGEMVAMQEASLQDTRQLDMEPAAEEAV